MNTLKNYYELCKPNVVLMMLITALVGSLLASKTLPPISLIAFAMLGIALCASSAAAINQIIDRKVDANMNRTENRPIPQGDVSPVNASIFALILGVLGAVILVVYVNTLTAILTLASLIGYAFIYTVYLKRATPQNIVIGGLAGAAPPLLGWTAITNSVDPNALLLVLGAIFLIYSIRLYRDKNNENAFPTFVYSIYYIFLIFAALLIDHYLI
ncbi:protoheme IX farnesyltransferase [Pseudomonadota bacterium]|nr:protoheme IX farnesyltransferase [Pseudomonadota bacterium]